MAWPPRDTCYLIVSPNPTFATQGVAHTQGGVTLHYFRIKFGDGSHLTPGRYDTCNADFYARDNNNILPGMYLTPNPANTDHNLRRCGKFLERMILQEIGYHIPGGNLVPLEQIGNATGGETEWYRIWARPGNDITGLGQLLTGLVNHFPNAALGLASVQNVLNNFNVHNATVYNNMNKVQRDNLDQALVEACETEATAYAQSGGNNSVVYRLANSSRVFQDP